MRTNRNPWIASLAVALATTLLAAPAGAVRYCTSFNDAYLTRILTGQDDCLSQPCGFYEHDFADAREECGDEVFRIKGTNQDATCNFCFWSECFTVRQNEFGIVALDEIGPLEATPAFRMRVLTAPSTAIIFRGGVAGDNPPMSTQVNMEAGRDYVFFLIQDHTRDEALADPTIPVFFSIAGANSDAYDHLISLTSHQNHGAVAFGWEDLVGGGDNDLNDVVFTTQCELKIKPSGLPRPPSSPSAPTSPAPPASTPLN